jgi:UDP-glucose 4-epimerase
MSELAIKDFCASSNLKATILRYFNVAGSHPSGQWGQIGDEHTVLVKRAALAAIGKIPQLEIFGTNYSTPDGTAIRDYIHVEDLADLHLLALQGLSQSQFSGVLNCGYGQGFSVRQVIESMKKVSASDFKTIESEQRQGDLACVVADNSKLLKLFKWQPRYNDLDLICRSAYDWETREMALRKSDDDSKARKV